MLVLVPGGRGWGARGMEHTYRPSTSGQLVRVWLSVGPPAPTLTVF